MLKIMAADGTPAICTIIAKNYVSFARTLCASFLKYHPDGACYALVVDDIDHRISPDKEMFEIVSLEQLGIPDLPDFCFKYNITELCTAAKPYFLGFLLKEKSLSRILYLDPDILVTNPLSDVYRRFDDSDIILTPHLDSDFPEDGLFPDDSHILKSGIFNLGFIGVRRCDNTERFLSWWKGKTFDKCRIDHANGYFVDQRFIDLAFTLFPNIGVLGEAGYNVAYWNLHSRSISFDRGEWQCGGGKLYFFHFSDFKPDRPNRISRHQTRYQLENLPDLGKLFTCYTELLMSNGFPETKTWPYTHDYFRNGIFINFVIRKLYRTRRAVLDKRTPFDFGSYPVRYRILFRLLAFSYGIYRAFRAAR